MKPTRLIKLVVNPRGIFRKHQKGMPIPFGWILIKDESVFYKGELINIFRDVPFLTEDDFDEELDDYLKRRIPRGSL